MNNLEIPKESTLDKLYSITKGAFGGIPFAGGVASETFGLILSQPITKRRELWMQAVVNKFQSLEGKIDGFWIENLKNDEEFISFLLESSQIAFKTHQEQKLDALKNSVGNYYVVQISFDKKISFLRVIDNLTPTHFDILLFISHNETLIVEKTKGFKALNKLYISENQDKIDRFYFRKCVRDLESESLIRISGDFQDFIGGGSFATDESAPSIALLDYGKEFINYIVENK